MTRWQMVKEIRVAMSDPERIGDVPALKSELSKARASSEVEALLDDVRGYAPEIDTDALMGQAPDTFGNQYARFLRANDLHPLRPTGRLDPELVRRNAFVVRYGIIHDMVHVLTGFDTTWPGEVGVWAFVGAQRYSTGFRVAGLMALLVAPLRCPLQLRRAWRCWNQGRALGRRAIRLLPLRLEEYLGRNLEEVRAELDLPSGRMD